MPTALIDYDRPTGLGLTDTLNSEPLANLCLPKPELQGGSPPPEDSPALDLSIPGYIAHEQWAHIALQATIRVEKFPPKDKIKQERKRGVFIINQMISG
jgi:hypothetical protein